MRVAGLSAITVGIALIIFAVFFDTTVGTTRILDIPGLSGSNLDMPSRMHNLGLLQTQMMLLHAGLASVVAGSVLTGVGELVRRFEHSGLLKPIERPTGPVPASPASCNWCDRKLPAGFRTCTSYDLVSLSRVAGKVRDPVCKEQLRERGYNVVS